MRLIPYLAVGAGLASAAPLSIIVSTTDVGSFRLGKPVHDVKMTATVVSRPSRMRMACNKMQGGVAKLFALAGLGPVVPKPTELNMAGAVGPEHHVAHFGHHGHHGEDKDQDSKQFWDPANPPHHIKWHHKGQDEAAASAVETDEVPHRDHRVHHMHHGGHFRHMHHRGSFIRRIHRALMSLGPWEGRAIAFVLGCGIGVLLRMLWVMAIVVKRAIRGEQEPSENETEYEHVAVLLPLENGDELFAAPPEYYADEKAPLPEPTDVKN